MISEKEYKIKSVILGHAVGDALGVPVEFYSREELDEGPVTDMKGFGTYPLPAGCWSDDTSMALAELDSLANGRADYDEIMQNFVKWYNEDEYTPTGEMFDSGNTCSTAIGNYFKRKMLPLDCGLSDEFSNGNGSLMRINPFVLFSLFNGGGELNLDLIRNGSMLTHAHVRSQIGCEIYAFILKELLTDPNKASVSLGLQKAYEELSEEPEISHYSRIFDADFENTDRSLIKSSGYIVDTLEAALWCLLTTDSYKDCVLKAVNLGYDTDTVAAVAGGLAGALYGFDSIPEAWLDALKRKDYIEEMCNRAGLNWK